MSAAIAATYVVQALGYVGIVVALVIAARAGVDR